MGNHIGAWKTIIYLFLYSYPFTFGKHNHVGAWEILSTSLLDPFIFFYIRKTRRRDAYIRDTILKTGLAANIRENVKVTIYMNMQMW